MPGPGYIQQAATTMNEQRLAASRTEKGQSLVELVISLTVLLILLTGTIDFGIGLFHYIAMSEAAQEGALVGSINPPPRAGSWDCPDPYIKAICDRVINSTSGEGLIKDLYDSGMIVNVSAPDNACEGYRLTVTLVYEYPLSMPFLGTVLGSDHIILRSAATDTILTPDCP